ncbi:hypothetical protein R3P38DRAFT_2910184 [Favolaschia claudopus]|uniref:Shugoshin C-terminal domain-containing protein n=1 Tax=Favolaschia claudopus TaxID=2862362 RepID=A0AAW0CCB9_9AGAR
MSRRESRVSMNVRQNDALFEFENFKKKFLLANKHITKLNSTLSMKIEELNTEIATLCSENLRLRTSEIALSAQLKREREKSRKIMSDAEAATQALMSQFGFLRQTFNIPVHAPPSPTPTPPRRPTSSPRNSTYANNVNRLAREPQVSNIHEDEEPEEVPPSPRKTKKKARLSASKLPLPARSSTPPVTLGTPAPSAPVLAPPHLDLSVLALPTKKRRQSGLLLDLGVVDIDALEVDEETEYEQPRDKEKEVKRRTRDDGTLLAAVIKPKPKLKDVTNANPPRSRSKTDTALDSALAPLTLETQVQARAFLVAAPASPPPPEPQPRPVPPQLAVAPPEPPPQPVSSGSSSSLDSASDRASEQRGYTTEPTSTAPEAETGGRERRTRKSVNYTEPKLNTKMRKSGLPAGSVPAQDPAPTKRSRSSAAAAVPVSTSSSGSSSGSTTRRPSPPLRTSTRPSPPLDGSDVEEDGEESDGWADGEYVPSWAATSHVNVEGRRRTQTGRPRKGEAGVVVEEWAREREKEARRHSAVV